jgi:hypothetical protein
MGFYYYIFSLQRVYDFSHKGLYGEHVERREKDQVGWYASEWKRTEDRVVKARSL